MPHFLFSFSPSQAGCVERVCLSVPWTQTQRTPQGGTVSPSDAAWNYLQSVAAQRDSNGQPLLVFPQGAKIDCNCLNPAGSSPNQPPTIYCIQICQPVV